MLRYQRKCNWPMQSERKITMLTSLGHTLYNHYIQLWDIPNTTTHFMKSWLQNSQTVFATSDMVLELMQKGNSSQYTETPFVYQVDMIYSESETKSNNSSLAIHIQTCCMPWTAVYLSQKLAVALYTKSGHIQFSRSVVIGFCHKSSKNKISYYK